MNTFYVTKKSSLIVSERGKQNNFSKSALCLFNLNQVKSLYIPGELNPKFNKLINFQQFNLNEKFLLKIYI